MAFDQLDGGVFGLAGARLRAAALERRFDDVELPAAARLAAGLRVVLAFLAAGLRALEPLVLRPVEPVLRAAVPVLPVDEPLLERSSSIQLPDITR